MSGGLAIVIIMGLIMHIGFMVEEIKTIKHEVNKAQGGEVAIIYCIAWIFLEVLIICMIVFMIV